VNLLREQRSFVSSHSREVEKTFAISPTGIQPIKATKQLTASLYARWSCSEFQAASYISASTP